MIAVAAVLGGVGLGVQIVIVWAALDALAGTQTFTEAKGLAVIGLCVVGVSVLVTVGCIVGDIINDRRQRERGWTSRPPAPPPRVRPR